MIPYCILTVEDDSDREFMTWLFENYHRLMYKKISRLISNQWDIEDVLQDVVEQLTKKVKKLRGMEENRRMGYIIVACKHRAINHICYANNHPSVLLVDYYDLSDEGTGKDEMDLRLIDKSERECFCRLWDKLDGRTRYILEGVYILEQTNAEMAKELGMKPDSFRMALTRARRAALAKLKDAYEKGE